MYGIVAINMIAVSFTHYGKAPSYLTVLLPAVFSIFCLIRSVKLLTDKAELHTLEALRRKLLIVVALSFALGAGISSWAIALFSYGDIYTKGQVAFFIAVTIVAVITCLMPLRQVSVILFATVVVPSTVFLIAQPEPVFQAIAVNMLLVVTGMVFVLWRSNSDFQERIEKQHELDSQRRVLQGLNDKVSLLANQDSLTDLPNRRSFFTRLDSIIASEGGGRSFVVGVIDLDGFKPVNDVHGHGAGDKLLRAVAARLKEQLPSGGMLARLGGDEFAIVLLNCGTDKQVLKTCESMLAALTPPFALDEGSASISATCGVARFPDAGRTGDELYERADFALYYSKENNRGSVTIFSQQHEAEIKNVATISQRLREADLENDLSLQFQPIVDARNGAILGYEALARWSDQVLGRVPPDVFIRSAEQNGTIGRITIALLRRALATATEWRDNTYLSFNLSAQDLCSPETINQILGLLEESSFPARRLVFEITESAIMQDFDRATVSIEWLRAAGASIALDDFGTGYSSLNYLRRLPIDRIKLDRSFVMDIEKEQAAKDIVRAIVELSKNMHLQCIIEGVETHTQLQILGQMGCTAYQGYLFGKARDAAAIGADPVAYSELRQAC